MQSEYSLTVQFDVEFSSLEETAAGLRQWLSIPDDLVSRWWAGSAGYPATHLFRLRVPGNFPSGVRYTTKNLDRTLAQVGRYSRLRVSAYLMVREGVFAGPHVGCSTFAPDGFGPSRLVRVSTSFGEQEAIENAEPFRHRMSLVREFADRWAPRFGHVSYSYKTDSQTTLELCLRAPACEDIDRIRAWARGYSWVTVLSDAFVERLGGIHALQDSHAFTKVEPLASGSVWLQATDTWPEYDMDAVHRVFEALRPVIRPGNPQPTNLRKYHYDLPPELVVFSPPDVTPDRSAPRSGTSAPGP